MTDIDAALQQIFERQFRHFMHRVSVSEQPQWCGYGQHWAKGVYQRRQNTQYADEDSNWVICCGECFAEIERQWQDQWAEYYSMVM